MVAKRVLRADSVGTMAIQLDGVDFGCGNLR